jgi:hypothetical protein
MKANKEASAGVGMRALHAATLTLLILGAIPVRLPADATKNEDKRTMTSQSKFYCNIKALSPVERSEHKQLTDKLITLRRKIVETNNGYDFQFDPSEVSIEELSKWVVAEGKCCPFFDFHIDFERAGKLLCLRLTAEDGIKPFIRSEFQVPANSTDLFHGRTGL